MSRHLMGRMMIHNNGIIYTLEATLQQQQQEQQQQQQPVHVIQIGNNVYDIIPITNQNYDQIYCNGPHNRPNNNHLHHHHNCVTNPAFIMDHEGGIYPAGNNTVLGK